MHVCSCHELLSRNGRGQPFWLRFTYVASVLGGQRALDLGALAADGELAAYAERNYLGSVSRPFALWKRSI
eukprot:COSAG01_NODE_7068_length_3366_cov_8.453350_2_plen_71_part_00